MLDAARPGRRWYRRTRGRATPRQARGRRSARSPARGAGWSAQAAEVDDADPDLAVADLVHHAVDADVDAQQSALPNARSGRGLPARRSTAGPASLGATTRRTRSRLQLKTRCAVRGRDTPAGAEMMPQVDASGAGERATPGRAGTTHSVLPTTSRRQDDSTTTSRATRSDWPPGGRRGRSATKSRRERSAGSPPGMRGDDGTADRRSTSTVELPLQARGRRGLPQVLDPHQGATPARAGTTISGPISRPARTSYPRSRGDDRPTVTTPAGTAELPPLTRELLEHAVSAEGEEGTTGHSW